MGCKPIAGSSSLGGAENGNINEAAQVAQETVDTETLADLPLRFDDRAIQFLPSTEILHGFDIRFIRS
jgi:hypothetical protein